MEFFCTICYTETSAKQLRRGVMKRMEKDRNERPIIPQKKYGEDQLDVNSNPSQNSSSNRQNGDMSMYKWTKWSKKRSAKGKSDFNPVSANILTTGGLVAGATGGMEMKENVLERMERIDAKRKIADFQVKMKM